MRFRQVGRRPDGRLSALPSVIILLLPSLIGGGDSPAYLPRSAGPPEPEVTIPVRVFLTPEGWANPEFGDLLAGVPAEPRFRSEWLRAVSVEVDPGSLADLSNLPGVSAIRPVAGLAPAGPVDREPDFALGATLPQPASGEWINGHRPQESFDSTYGDLGSALQILGIPNAHSLGFMGTGVRIGILDGTFDPGQATVRSRPPLAVRDFVDLDGSVSPGPMDPVQAASHGTALWSLVSGDLAGVLRGGAPGAEVLLARIRGFGALEPADEDRWVAGLEWLESQGARIVLSGVSFRAFTESAYGIEDLNGDGTAATRAADRAASRGVLVLAPIGNRGPGLQTLEAPADGDSVVATGAIELSGVPAAFSALGPTGDGRDKPDLYAPGVELMAASSPGESTLAPVSGTEFAAALLAGVGALVVEAYPYEGPMEVLRILSASTPSDTGTVVGVPDVASAILFPRGVLPLQLEEVNGEGQITNLAPQFRWTAPSLHPVGLPVTFFLELSEDSLFRSVQLSDSVVGTFARRPPGPLPARSRLFWRIRAQSVQGVERATGAQGPFLVPPWVRLEVLNDPGGSELADPHPLFRWSSPELLPPAGQLTFELQVVSDRLLEILQSYPGLKEKEFRVPSPLPFNVPLRWRVIAQSAGGGADTVTSAGPFVVTSGANPPATILYQNFPNPFPNREMGLEITRIWFDLAHASRVELAVFDIRGRLVRQLVPGRNCPPAEFPAGIYGREGGPPEGPCQVFSWDGRDDRDREVPPGVYLLRLEADGVVDVRRVVFWP
ncbi:MAG: S8 family serine peptidase [Longimicrobiales bacterium]